MPDAPPPPSDQPPVWTHRWFQITLAVLVISATLGVIVPPILSLIYLVRGVLAPVLIALGLAYVFDPLITRLQEKHNIRRPVSAGAIIALVALFTLTLALILTPPLIEQGVKLVDNLKNVYPQQIAESLESEQDAAVVDDPDSEPNAELELVPDDSEAVPVPEDAPVDGEAGAPETVEAEATDGFNLGELWDQVRDEGRRTEAMQTVAQGLSELEWSTVAAATAASLDVGVGVVGSAISLTMYLLLATLITVFCFFFFSWKFHGILAWGVPYLPETHRDEVLRILTLMDRSITAFIRGRIIQTMVMAVVLSIGWWIAGVPYWLLLGVLGGALNLIPFVAIALWPVAVLLTWLDAISGGSFSVMSVMVWPTVAFWIAQGLDGWVVEPVVQGKATNLNPVAVFLAVMIGGTIAGLLGMLLAIPAAACIKILMEEIILPWFREMAKNRQADAENST